MSIDNDEKEDAPKLITAVLAVQEIIVIIVNYGDAWDSIAVTQFVDIFVQFDKYWTKNQRHIQIYNKQACLLFSIYM